MIKKLFVVVLCIMSSLYSVAQDELSDEFDPDALANDSAVVEADSVHIDSLVLQIPAYELYDSIWVHDCLNPYKVKIDNLPDSLHIDCSSFVYPTLSNRITSGFGLRRYRYHFGTDIGICVGDSVWAAFDGLVRMVRYNPRGYGYYIIIRHYNGLETLYAHLARPLVTIDQEVKAGDLIAWGGNTGRSTGPHLHFELRLLGNAFNPTKLIDYTNRTAWFDDYVITKKDTYSHKKELDELAKAAYHKVRSGDTLSSIARRYGTSVKRLCQLNKISSKSILRVGQRIRYR